MAKGKAKKGTPNRDLEALGLFLLSLGAFLLTGAFPGPTGAVGAWVHDLLYRPLGVLGYTPSLFLFASGGAFLLAKPPGKLLRPLAFGLFLLLSLLPFLGEALGEVGRAAQAFLRERLGVIAYLLSALLAIALLDLWARRPPLKSLLEALKLGVEGVRRSRLWLKTLLLRAQLARLAHLYPDHPTLATLGKRLFPEELPQVEEALKAFIRERVSDLEEAIRAEARPLEPELKALARGLEKPLLGRGPFRDALEERRG
ncbi:MAG: DNA translocase FtsK, partial [Thermus sp.]